MRIIKALTLLAFLNPAKAFTNSNGIIEMDVKVSNKPSKKYTPGLGSHLMSLDSAKHPDYIEKELLDFFDIQIYSKIYLGSDKQEFDMIFDTGSSWVWVQHDLCKTCANKEHFNSMASSTFEQLTPNFSSLYYGKGMVIGYDTTD